MKKDIIVVWSVLRYVKRGWWIIGCKGKIHKKCDSSTKIQKINEFAGLKR